MSAAARSSPVAARQHAAEIVPLSPRAARPPGSTSRLDAASASEAPLDADEFGSARDSRASPAEDPFDDHAASFDGLEGDTSLETEGEEAAFDAGFAARRAAGRQAATAAALPTSADDATLAAWIERIARQDERALEALYDATSARVNGVILRITQRASLAEEVLEDTFWQVWRQAPRFDAQRGRPITWLLAMARSRAIDALRREQRFQHEELPEDDTAEALGEGGSAAAPPPQDLLEATRQHAHVHAALASLEPRSRQLVSLAFFRGLTHEEIAEQQGMPLGTVKSLIRRALQQLKRVMEAEHA